MWDITKLNEDDHHTYLRAGWEPFAVTVEDRVTGRVNVVWLLQGDGS